MYIYFFKFYKYDFKLIDYILRLLSWNVLNGLLLRLKKAFPEKQR